MLATLLNEMDGIDGPDSGTHSIYLKCHPLYHAVTVLRIVPHLGIVVVGTSNRIDLIDAALLRKGRLNQLVEMKNPDKDDALALLRYFASQYKLTGISAEKVIFWSTALSNLCVDLLIHWDFKQII